MAGEVRRWGDTRIGEEIRGEGDVLVEQEQGGGEGRDIEEDRRSGITAQKHRARLNIPFLVGSERDRGEKTSARLLLLLQHSS